MVVARVLLLIILCVGLVMAEPLKKPEEPSVELLEFLADHPDDGATMELLLNEEGDEKPERERGGEGKEEPVDGKKGEKGGGHE
jgi:hypothetical protein